MDDFIRRIVDSLTKESSRLSVVKNPDGFLKDANTQQKVLAECGLLLLPVNSSLELRVRYELEDKDSENRICYIMDNISEILPDIKRHLYEAPTFTISKLLPACNEMELRQAQLTFGMASYIYHKRFTRDLSAIETRQLLGEAESLYGMDIHEVCAKLKAVPLNWEKVETIEQISEILLKIIAKGQYHEVEETLNEINEDFQNFIDKRYFSLINSSHVQKPKMVNKILPYLNLKHQRSEKVALVVIDGMTYWQYMLLDKALSDIGIQTNRDMTFAWLPSITKLSRQAIFRGEAPQMDYRQSPVEESRLWSEFWTSRPVQKRMQDYEIGYTHGGLSIENENLYRQAVVDTNLDEMMHSLDNNKNLFSLTTNWAIDAAEDVKTIHEQGYHIYITTDHGNVLSNPWRALSPQEKTFLYEKESRGNRHLIYNNTEHLQNFIHDNQEIAEQMLVHDNWAIWRNTKSFCNREGITHGGSHFLEVVIPFITIEKK